MSSVNTKQLGEAEMWKVACSFWKIEPYAPNLKLCFLPHLRLIDCPSSPSLTPFTFIKLMLTGEKKALQQFRTVKDPGVVKM